MCGAGRAETSNRTSQGPEILVNAATRLPIMNAAAPENGQNHLYRRNYVAAGSPETYCAGTRFDARPITFGGVDYVGRLITNANANGAVREINSLMLATQSRFFRGRLIATGGLRRDRVDITPFTAARIASTDPRVAAGEKIANAFDSERIQVIRLNRVGDGYWRVVPRESRSFRLSVSLGF